MIHEVRFVALSLALATIGQCAPAASQTKTSEHQYLHARTLLGTSFGVPNTDRSFDYVVVGGGTAGLAVAARLSEDPSKMVAVVEAGGFYEIGNGNLSQIPVDDVYWDGKDADDVNPLVDWGFMTTPQVGENGNSSHYARGKTLGGCSARNYMAYQRPTKDSLAKWAKQVGDSSYEWHNFLPYYQKSVEFTPPDNIKRGANATPSYDLSLLGKGHPLSLTFSNYAMAFSTWAQKALQTIGVAPINGFTSGRLIGSSYVIAAINHTTGMRESSETAFLQPAIGRPNLVVYTNTLGKKVLFSGKKATGVQVETDGYKYTLTANKEVILSAGVFQSPQLLMVSGVGPAATLNQHNIGVVADRPGVGQNMWDHVLFGPSYRVNMESTSRLGDPVFANEAVIKFNEEQAGILASTGGDFLAFEKVPFPFRSSFTRSTLSDLATFPRDWPEIEWLSVAGFFGYQNNYIRKGPTDGHNYATMSMALVAPLSRGSVTISSADTNDQPVINPNWLSSPTDQQVAIAAYKRVRQFFETPVMRTVEIGPEAFPGTQVQTDAQILELIKESFNTVYHASATCAMGKTSDPNAVVDSHARVIGVKNLRVVDASAMPFLPPGHPMATVYALAEKIAADIHNGH